MFVSPYGILKLVVKCYTLNDNWNSLPYEWNAKGQKFCVKSVKSLEKRRLKLRFAIVFTFATIIQFVFIKDALTLPEVLQCMFYIVFSSCACYVSFDQSKNSSEVVALLNRMIQFEINRNVKDLYKWHSGVKKEHDLRRKLCGPTLRIFTYTSICIPFLSQLSFVRKPCIPIQPGFFFVKKCNTVDSLIIPHSSFLRQLALPLPSIIPTLALSLVTFIMRMFMITAFNSQICMIAPIKAYCFHSYQLYTKMLIQRHFLYHNAPRKSKDGPLTSVKHICTLLREIQILVKNFNYVYTGSIVCCLLFAVTGEILSLYAFIVVGNQLPPERRFIYGFAAFDMLLCITLFYGLLGNIYELSVSVLNVLKSCEAFMTRRVNSKFLQSCPTLNICLGSSNFIEKITPLNCQSLVVQRYVDLSLLTRNSGLR